MSESERLLLEWLQKQRQEGGAGACSEPLPSPSSRVQGECVAVTMVCEKTKNNGEFSVACEWDPVLSDLIAMSLFC